MKKKTNSQLFSVLGFLFSTVPVISAVLSYFPLWREHGSEELLSGFTLLLLFLSMIPLFRILKAKMKTPAAHTLWFIIFIFFYVFSKIADELTVISFVGFIGNLIGALFFKLSSGMKRGNINEEV